MGTRHNYMTKLVDDAQERAKACHLEYQRLDDEANNEKDPFKYRVLRNKAQSSLNDFFYWIGHANAYRGIRMQVEIWEMVDEEMDAEGSCP